MNDYKQIRVSMQNDGKLHIIDSCGFPMIGIGGHGAVFRLDEQRCIKVYSKDEQAEIEKQAYLKASGSPIMPVLYEAGPGYLVIEYINGPNLKDYLGDKASMPRKIVRELVNMFLEMDRLCFLRRDESLRHILLNNSRKVKIIDHFYAYTLYDPMPVKMFRQLDEIGMLETFIYEGSRLEPRLFRDFQRNMPGFFKNCGSEREVTS